MKMKRLDFRLSSLVPLSWGTQIITTFMTHVWQHCIYVRTVQELPEDDAVTSYGRRTDRGISDHN